jgi:alpha-tubulin suppressor-like RCC1 family protein
VSAVAEVTAGGNHSLILKTDGTLWACGYNLTGQLGNDTTTASFYPIKITSDVKDISAGFHHPL